MEHFEDIEEFSISSDIVFRMAVVAFAKICPEEEINSFFEEMKNFLIPSYKEEKVVALVNTFQNATLEMRNNFEEIDILKGINENI